MIVYLNLKFKRMAITINSMELLQGYFLGVLNRAKHHGGNVRGVALALLGAIIWKATGEIEVKEYDGSPANILWFWIGESRYAMTYSHENSHIVLRERSLRGTPLHAFDNSTTYEDILRIFGEL